MKTAWVLKISMVSLIALFMVGCGGSSKVSNGNSVTPAPAPTPTPTPETPASTTWPYSVSGEVATFVPVSYEMLNTYVAIRPLNNPSDVKININLHNITGTSFYAGKIQIGYTDNGQFYYGSFTAGDGKNSNCSNCRDNGLYEAAPNFWSTIGGVKTFMAYVQDQYGSLIIVMEAETAGADGEAGGLLKGRVYFRNFANGLYPQSSERKCWYLYAGPYACYSNNMSQKLSSTDFSDGTYRLLGTFSGVNRAKALGQ